MPDVRADPRQATANSKLTFIDDGALRVRAQGGCERLCGA